MKRKENVDLWLDIPGYERKYQASYTGDIRRLYKSSKPRVLKPYRKKGRSSNAANNWLYIKLTDDQGQTKEYSVHILIALTFIGKCPVGHVVRHTNGMHRDNFASNLEYISRVELGKQSGGSSKRKTVAKIDCLGEVVEIYSSARQCARKNFFSYQTIIDRCNGKGCKRTILAPDGYAYAWDEDERTLNNVIKKVIKERGVSNSIN